jgi:hypothetical protein
MAKVLERWSGRLRKFGGHTAKRLGGIWRDGKWAGGFFIGFFYGYVIQS